MKKKIDKFERMRQMQARKAEKQQAQKNLVNKIKSALPGLTDDELAMLFPHLEIAKKDKP